MNKGKILTAIGVVFAAALAMTLAVLLVLSLKTQFSPKPTEYPNSEWISEDGRMKLSVGEYDSEVYQCRAVLNITDGEGNTASYEVSDGGRSMLYLLEGDTAKDRWARVKCNKDSFTVRVNNIDGSVCASIYEKGEKVVFNRAE